MHLFTKIIEKPVYVNTLQEWRATKVHDFHMLDRVWIIRTLQQSEYSHPHCKWHRVIKYKPQEGVIVGTATSTIYSDTKVGEEIKYEGWEYLDPLGKEVEEMKGDVIYRFRKGYRVLLRNGTHVDAHTVKLSHGEFQEEFDHMQEVEMKKMEVIDAESRYRKSLEGMEQLLAKGKKIQITMTDKLMNATRMQ